MPTHRRGRWTYVVAAAVLATVVLMLVSIPLKEFDEKYEPVGKSAGRKNLPPGSQEVLLHNRLTEQDVGVIPGKASPNPFSVGQLVFSSVVDLGYKRPCHGRYAYHPTSGRRAG